MLEIKRDWKRVLNHMEEKATASFKNGWLGYKQVMELLFKGAAVAERLAAYYSEFGGFNPDTYVVTVGGFGSCNDTCTFHIHISHKFWGTGKHGMIEVNMKTGRIMVNVEGLHERNKWTEYKKPIDTKEVLKLLIESSNISCIVGEVHWHDGKTLCKVLEGIKYCSTIYEYEMSIIHPVLGYTSRRVHYKTFIEDYPELMEYVTNKDRVPEWALKGAK